jgi:hypothetical protein
MPDPNPDKNECEIKFHAKKKKLLCPIVGYFDFEAAQKKPENACPHCGRNKQQQICTHVTQVELSQTPISYTLLFVDSNGKIVHLSQYTGADAAEHFIDSLKKLEKPLYQQCQRYRNQMVFTPADKKMYDAAATCWMCDGKFTQEQKTTGSSEAAKTLMTEVQCMPNVDDLIEEEIQDRDEIEQDVEDQKRQVKTGKGFIKVRDHCHYTGLFIGNLIMHAI